MEKPASIVIFKGLSGNCAAIKNNSSCLSIAGTDCKAVFKLTNFYKFFAKSLVNSSERSVTLSILPNGI